MKIIDQVDSGPPCQRSPRRKSEPTNMKMPLIKVQLKIRVVNRMKGPFSLVVSREGIKSGLVFLSAKKKLPPIFLLEDV